MPVTHSFAVAFWHIKAQVFKFLSEKTHSFSRKHESKNEQVTSKEFADHSSTAHANISPRNLPFPDSLNFHSVIKPNTSAAPLCNQSFLNTSVTTTVTTSQSTLSKNSSALTAGTAMPQLSTFESYMQPISYSAGMTTTSTPTVQASGLFFHINLCTMLTPIPLPSLCLIIYQTEMQPLRIPCPQETRLPIQSTCQ